jgi:hypothetical protein
MHLGVEVTELSTNKQHHPLNGVTDLIRPVAQGDSKCGRLNLKRSIPVQISPFVCVESL